MRGEIKVKMLRERDEKEKRSSDGYAKVQDANLKILFFSLVIKCLGISLSFTVTITVM